MSLTKLQKSLYKEHHHSCVEGGVAKPGYSATLICLSDESNAR